MILTAVLVDLVGYSDMSLLLEESLGVQATLKLNNQVQQFITNSLSDVGENAADNIVITTGDGALLKFIDVDKAIDFAERLHHISSEHNANLSEPRARRVFRVGIATGEIAIDPDNCGLAGMAISRAARLEAKANPGGVLIDDQSWAASGLVQKQLFQGPEIIAGKRDESFKVWRAQIDQHGQSHAAYWMKSASDAGELVATKRLASQRDVSTNMSGEPPTLVILPFTNRSRLVEDEMLAAEMVEDIIANLSQGVNVRVVASSETSDDSGGSPLGPKNFGERYGARYSLVGNLRRIGDELRITVQLQESGSGIVLWTRKFAANVSELAAVQEDITFELSAHLDAQIHRLEMTRSIRKSTDLTAWEATTRAFAYLHHACDQSTELQIEEASHAIEIAPDYGPGHAMLAQCLAIRYCNFIVDDADEVALVRMHVNRAHELERDSAYVLSHNAQALNLIGFPEEGLRHAERARAISPGMAFAHHACGTASVLLDRIELALAFFRADVDASPGAHTHFLSLCWQANAYIRAGRFEEAELAIDESRVLNPHYGISIATKALISAVQGRSEEALSVFSQAHRLEKDVSSALWAIRVRRRFVGNPIADTAAAHILQLCSQVS